MSPLDDPRMAPAWAVILAGGDGTRLRSLTRLLTGDDRPKQFCPVLGTETLLEQTRQRAALVVPPARTLHVVTRAHEAYYRPALTGVDPRTVVVQPANRGTAPAILAALLRLGALGAAGPVVILPSDHFVDPPGRFMAQVADALAAVRLRPDVAVLLGMVPDRAEAEYGWIEPGEALAGAGRAPLWRVRRFAEKPAAPEAEALRARGGLWNTFVMVGQVGALERLVRRARPDLATALAPLGTAADPGREEALAREIYARLEPVDFSAHVLQARPGDLAVMPVRGVAWNDLGDPARVRATRARLGQPQPVPA